LLVWPSGRCRLLRAQLSDCSPVCVGGVLDWPALASFLPGARECGQRGPRSCRALRTFFALVHQIAASVVGRCRASVGGGSRLEPVPDVPRRGARGARPTYRAERASGEQSRAATARGCVSLRSAAAALGLTAPASDFGAAVPSCGALQILFHAHHAAQPVSPGLRAEKNVVPTHARSVTACYPHTHTHTHCQPLRGRVVCEQPLHHLPHSHGEL
jgi:hypothetical protein